MVWKFILTFWNINCNGNILIILKKLTQISIPKSKTTIFGTRVEVFSDGVAMLISKKI